jgi:3-deoxy-7-phosphoheptulonate synthase/chorismate mutase
VIAIKRAPRGSGQRGSTTKEVSVIPLLARRSGPPIRVTVRGHSIGGATPLFIAGPCSVESARQVDEVARGLRARGVRFFRGGAFKPRTSPYAFQGLGLDGLRLLRDACRRHDLVSVSEATSPENVELVAEYVDVLQIGARNMYNYELLRAAGRSGRPVLLKRGLSATIDEWLSAAEYIALTGNHQIVLCERGVRTFARETRGTLDLSAVPLVKLESRLPVIVDVSHAAGRRDLLAPLAAAALAVGADGVMLEVHPDPDRALSDAEQQISLDGFDDLTNDVRASLARAAQAMTATTTMAIAGATPTTKEA